MIKAEEAQKFFLNTKVEKNKVLEWLRKKGPDYHQ